MKRCLYIAALLLALMIPAVSHADLINVTCDGVAGNLVCRDVSGNIIYTVDATNRKITIPSGSAIDIASGGYFKLAGTTVTATAAKLNMIPADGAAGTYLQTDGSGSWTWVAGTSGSLDDAYNTGATITVDSGAVQLNGSHGSNDTFFVNKTAGTGDAIQITNAGTGNDINGTGGTWSVTKAGVATFASFSPLTAGLSITGGTVNLNESSNFAVNIGTGTSTGTVTIGGAAAQQIDIGNGAAAKTVTLGSSNTTSATTLLSGSGAVNVNVSNNQPTNINTGTSTGTTTIGNANSFVTVAGVVTGASPLVFDGNTTNVNKTTLAIVDPTAARTITLPDATGTANLNCTATHDYSGGAADWTLSVAEMQCGYITVSNASGAVNAILPSAIPGKTYTVTNGSGDVLTFKVTGQTGGTIANGKWGFYTTIAADVAEVYELP